MKAHHVHVTFDDHQSLEIASRLPCLVQSVELATLVKKRGFRRIQILRFALIDDAPAETDDASARVANRKHQSVAEPIIESGSALTVVGPLAAIGSLHDESHL